ncbi:MAG: hydantoinase/oxoprolinase family protein [Acidobacteriaceae bacterium]|nr:hydantoinase/oxoprolinase family protein [Acidobacteriaceae bacterium]
MWTVDIDVGGTLTDGIFTNGDQIVCVKVDSTPHDLTVCLFDCLSRAAEQLQFPGTVEFLEEVELIRWSTTITSNVVAELHGPRIGLLVTNGHEKDLYGGGPAVVLKRLVSEKDVIGIDGSADETEIMNAARALLESGVRRICVSLKGSAHSHEREIAIKNTVDEQYPDHFLGSVPVLAGSDISKVADDQTRTYCALINAYTHGALASTLFKAEDELRENYRYPGNFLVSHVNGGVAGIGKTKAIDTIESGPILGIHGSGFLARVYGLSDVVALDVGGTTAKVGVLRGAEPIYRKPSDFFGIPVGISLPYLRSIALGGGSVVKPAADGIQLGPESQGSYPGPACYGLGGDRATLTDAFVTAGLIDPNYFLGGAKPLDAELARKIIEDEIARPLNLSADEACARIIDRAFHMVADLINDAARDLNEDFSKHTLFAYGGNGGLFACGVADKCGVDNVQLFWLGPVFSAFGSSVSDILHVYERAVPDSTLTDAGVTQLGRIFEQMRAESVQDLLGEGIREKDVSYTVELEVSDNGQASATLPVRESSLASAKELETAIAKALGRAAVKNGLRVDLIRLRAKKPMTKPHLNEQSSSGDAFESMGTRKVAWGSRSGEAQLLRWESLRPGNAINGPALVEGVNTTYFVPEDWTMTMDGFRNASLTRAATAHKTNTTAAAVTQK